MTSTVQAPELAPALPTPTTEASTCASVVLAVYTFADSVKASIQRLFDDSEWDPDHAVDALPSTFKIEVERARLVLDEVWRPAGIDTAEVCPAEVAQLLQSCVAQHANGQSVSVQSTLLIRGLLEAIAAEDGSPSLASGLARWTTAAADAEQAVAVVAAELDEAIEAGDTERARELRDRATIELPKALQDAGRVVLMLRLAQQLTRTVHAEARVENAKTGIELADQDVKAAEEALEQAHLRRHQALRLVRDAERIQAWVKADTCDLNTRADAAAGEQAIDPERQARRYEIARVRSELGLPAVV